MAWWAWVVQILWPLTSQPPSVRSAVVFTEARSDPASGSLMPRQNTASPEAIRGTISSWSSRVPCRRTAGPICRSPIQCAATGAPARSNSSVTASRSTLVRAAPPNSFGYVIAMSPRAASSLLNSRSKERSQESLRGT